MEREALMALLEEGLSLDGIAARVGRAPSTISYWLAKHSLAANGAARFAPKGALSRDALADLVSEGLSVRAMAERLCCSPAMVRRALKRNALHAPEREPGARSRGAAAR